MKSKRLSICRTVWGLLGSVALMMVIALGTAWAEKIPKQTNQKMKAVRVPFIMNQGQVDQQVRFYAKTFSGTVYVTNQGQMVYELPTGKDQKDQRWVLVEQALNCLPVKEIKGEKESGTKVSFFTGNDPAKWKNGLPTYETINFGELYEGIALKLQAYGGSVEKLYYVSPGRDPKEIRIRVNGAESLKVNHMGELEAQTGNGPVVFSRPKAFQQAGNHQEEVEVAYVVDNGTYGFKVGSYDKSRELIIDPLLQSTYLGGSIGEIAYSMAVSGENVYVAGFSSSENFPGTIGGPQPGLGGYVDVFVALLNADLTDLIQSTYLGGEYGDGATSIAISGENVYVAGNCGPNFPGTSGGAQPTNAESQDGFVALLSADLTQLIQSTYLGGTGEEGLQSIAVSGENVYVAGYTYSTDFPGTSGGAQPEYGGGSADAFVALLSADLKTLRQSTYLGGTGVLTVYVCDYAKSIAVSGENVYVAGWTMSTDFPGTLGGYQSTSAGGDSFVSLLSADLTQLIQSTYLGGGGMEWAQSISISGENVYVAGNTYSMDFPGTFGGAQHVIGTNDDVFVSLLSADLTQLIQSTFLGGTGYDIAYSIALSEGNVYVAGATTSTDLPGTSRGAQPVSGGGTSDAFVSLLSGDLKTLKQSTYLGGSGSEASSEDIWSMVVLGGRVYVAGRTNSTDFPGTIGGAQQEYGGGAGQGVDAFVAVLSADLKGISIDIKPEDGTNTIDVRKMKDISVAIFSSPDFDSFSKVDQATLTFGAAGNEASFKSCARKAKDVNRDGLKDLVCTFSVKQTGFKCGDVEGILKGKTINNAPIKGHDSVSIVPCK